MSETIIRIKYIINNKEYNTITDLIHTYSFNNNKNNYNVLNNEDDSLVNGYDNYMDYIIHHLSYNHDMNIKYIKEIKIEDDNDYIHVILNQPQYNVLNDDNIIKSSIYLNYIIHYNFRYNHKQINDFIAENNHKTLLTSLNYSSKITNIYDIMCEVMNIIINNEFLKEHNMRFISSNELNNIIKINSNNYKKMNRTSIIIFSIIDVILMIFIIINFIVDKQRNNSSNY